MFKEEETQYCPMCEEWAEKYKQLENEYEGFAVKYTDMEIALKRKEQEREKLKIEVKQIGTAFIDKGDLLNNVLDKINQLKKNNEELRKFQEYWSKVEQKNLKLSTQSEIYKQALQEIKNLTENACCKDLESCKICVLRNSCTNQKILQFLQKCEVIDANIQS